ncbi:MAG: pyridine nucleotide-disulfide oxidoreductase, partial [Lachnospiraceae bacterium]|nr:pyridine nucleotide-disulfide oxidoreductase [Lachnospiraceae bacterium]
HDASRTANLHIRPAEELAVDLEDDFGLTKEEVLAEADRCLNCGCLAVNPSDLTTALVCLDACIVTNLRRISAKELFCRPSQEMNFLEKGEIMTEVILPIREGWHTAYQKFRDRRSIDFATVGLASAYRLEKGRVAEASIVMGAVAPVPMKAEEAEHYLLGKVINEETAEKAAQLALKRALPMEDNRYKINIAKAMIKQSLLDCIK